MFKVRFTNRSIELAQLRIQISEKILNGEIVSETGVNELKEVKLNQMIHEETTSIQSISENQLEAHFKNKLIDQLRQQVENVTRDMRKNLCKEYLKYKDNIEKEEGKFSDRELQRKIMEGINSMPVVENLSESELNGMFEEFWLSEDVLNSPEIKILKANIESTNSEQTSYYRRYVKEGAEFALESLRYEISVRSLFPDLASIYNWNFTAHKLQSIDVMEDDEYFIIARTYSSVSSSGKNKHGTTSVTTRGTKSQFKYRHNYGYQIYYSDSSQGFTDQDGHWHWSTGILIDPKHIPPKTQPEPSNLSKVGQWVKKGYETVAGALSGTSKNQIEANKYGTFMTELYSKYEQMINNNEWTQRNFDGMVDQSVIRDLCVGFQKAVEELATKYKIVRYLKPKFIVTCVMFAAYKMLLVRLIENNDQSSQKSDPVKQLDMKKDFYKKLFIMKLKGAQTSQIWQQQIIHRLKESIVQIYLQVDGSQATHHEVYELIKAFSNSQNNRFPSIETYRKFRFCMYMEIMNDAKSGADKASVFRIWKKICNYDMEPCEKDFIRQSFQR